MRFVLDATAIRSGMVISGEAEWFTTPSIISEIKKGRLAKDLELLSDISITVADPGPDSVNTIKEAASKTGDIGRLSEPDVSILALAFELGGILLTDDYSIQNVAEVLDIKYKSGSQEGIKEIYEWAWRCRGCGRYFGEEPAGKECKICGSEVRTVRKNKKR